MTSDTESSKTTDLTPATHPTVKPPEELQAQLMKGFVFPHLLTLGGLANWPANVPVLAQYNELIPELLKLPYDYAFRTDGQALAEGALLIWEYLGLDMVFAIVDSYSMEAESIGANINFYHDHIPDVDRSDFVIKTVTDLDKIKFNGLDSGRYPFLIEFWTAFVNYTGMPSFPEVCAPWSLATNIYGMENLLVACLTDPGFVHELMNRIVYDLQVPLIAELKQLFPGAANFTLPDAWCSPPMLTPAIIDEFVEPYLIKLDQAIGPELPFSHAAVWLPEKPGVDFDAYFGLIKRYNGTVNCFDPELFTLGPRYYRELADKLQMPLNLLVSPGFILTATAEQAAERAKLFALVGKDGITPCSTALACIPPFTPIENIKSYIAAVRTFGAPDADADTPFELPESDAGFNAFIKQKMENNVEGYSFSWLSHSGLEL